MTSDRLIQAAEAYLSRTARRVKKHRSDFANTDAEEVAAYDELVELRAAIEEAKREPDAESTAAQEMWKALRALYLAAPSDIVDEVIDKVRAAFRPTPSGEEGA